MSFKKINYDKVRPEVDKVIESMVAQDRVEVFLLIPKKLKNQLKIIATQHDTTLINIFEAIMSDYVGYKLKKICNIKKPTVRISKDLRCDYYTEDAEDLREYLYK